MRVSFRLPFVAGLDRSRMAVQAGRVRQYDPKKNRANKAVIRALYESTCRKYFGTVLKAQAGVPVSIVVHAYEPLPKSRPKRVERESFTFKPDIDNIIKLVLDGLNGVAYEDDRQVTSVVAEKHKRTRMWTEPHTTVTVIFQEGTEYE